MAAQEDNAIGTVEIRDPGAQVIDRQRAHVVDGPLQSSHPWIWIAALTVLGAALRVIGAGKGLWWDEIWFMIISVRHPLAHIITTFPGDTQHPLYSILARMSVLALGESAWSVRLPAILFGVAAIPMMYLLASSVTSRLEALLSTALLTVSYHHVWFSQNARGYSALAFWTLLSTYCLLRGVKTGRRGPYIAYAVASALGVYTHLTMMFLVASHFLICAAIAVADWRRDPKSKTWKLPLQAFLLAGVLTLLFYAPILTQVQNFFMHRPSAMRAVSTPRWAFWETLRGLTVSLGNAGVLVAAAGLLVAFGTWSYFKTNRLACAFFVLPALVTAGGAVLARGTMYPRFYFSLIGFAVLILVRGVTALPKWIGAYASPRLASPLTAILATLLLAASCLSLVRNYRFPKQDFEGAIQYVSSEKKSGEAVITAGATTVPVLQFYSMPWEDVDNVEKLSEICRRSSAVWVIYTFPRYLQGAVPAVAEMIRKEFTIVRVFPGTVGDGDVFVGRLQVR